MAKIELDRTYPHPRERVWRALTDSAALAEWLMPNDFEPTVGHRFTFRTDPAPGFDGIVHCEVLELAPPERLRFTWRGGPLDTVVTFDLAAVGDGTRLTMTQDGFRGLRAWLVSKMLKSGCRTIYGRRLPEVLDRMTDDGRLAPLPTEDDAACMPGRTRAWAWLASRFSKRK